MLTNKEWSQIEAGINGMIFRESGNKRLRPDDVLKFIKTFIGEGNEQSSDALCTRGIDRGSEGESNEGNDSSSFCPGSK